jgi:hypothetical protein
MTSSSFMVVYLDDCLIQQLLLLWCISLQAPGVDSVKLGEQFHKAAAHAPTRPHTMAPDK